MSEEKDRSDEDWRNRRQFIDRRQKQLPILREDERRKGDRRRGQDKPDPEEDPEQS
ncbi:MAG: hypothetical protein R3200_15540 [Xanthomonadales bacterium]|nr:hypothetical protein [Xanthomonadales bacterium]